MISWLPTDSEQIFFFPLPKGKLIKIICIIGRWIKSNWLDLYNRNNVSFQTAEGGVYDCIQFFRWKIYNVFSIHFLNNWVMQGV